MGLSARRRGEDGAGNIYYLAAASLIYIFINLLMILDTLPRPRRKRRKRMEKSSQTVNGEFYGVNTVATYDKEKALRRAEKFGGKMM